MWYSTGTVSVTNGSGTVTGSGTAFLANARIGDGIVIEGSTAMHEIIGIASDTSLTIRPAYAGTTGSGRQYATVPVLGYDKDLSDAFNQLRLQFGDKLSALQPWAYAATAAAARNDLELGSAALRQAIGTAPLYGRDSVVGTVSQSGGVPTGALVEYGSNANGQFWRYAGGMQLAWWTLIFDGSGPGVRESTWTYPAGFASSPGVWLSKSRFPQASSSDMGLQSTAGLSSSIFRIEAVGSAGGISVFVYALGRWHA